MSYPIFASTEKKHDSRVITPGLQNRMGDPEFDMEHRQNRSNDSPLLRMALSSHADTSRTSVGQDFNRMLINNGHIAVEASSQPSHQSCPLAANGPSACPFGGVCHTCPARIQKKLEISQPGDEYEQEADRVADEVMRMPDPHASKIHRNCAPCVDDENFPLQRMGYHDAEKCTPGYSTIAAPNVYKILHSSGQPLDWDARAMMEQRLGHDFSHVRVHTDAAAVESARAVRALAYTVGRNIVFGLDQYAPKKPTGLLLIAHELIHVLQQGKDKGYSTIKLDSENSLREKEAVARSSEILTNPERRGSVTVAAEAPPGMIQRGWPLVVAAGLGIAGGMYALWAWKCLKPLEDPMYIATFGDKIDRSGGFRLWYYNKIHAPISNNVWDAFGHCWVSCESTKRCGRITTAIAGKAREFWRERIDSNPHDSYQQDTNNQSLGRNYGAANVDCRIACQNAALPSGGIDLSAPQKQFWTPSTGAYPVKTSNNAFRPSNTLPDASISIPGGVPSLDAGVP